MRTRMETVLLTPELARELLESMPEKQRNLCVGHLKDLADSMTNGVWKSLNGESIKIDTNGHMTDGQHRCRAVILSGIPYETYLVRNCPVDDYLYYDVGKRRTMADVLSMQNEKNTRLLASVLYMLYSYRRKGDLSNVCSGKRPKDPKVYLKLLSDNPSIRKSVSNSCKFSLGYKTQVAFFHYIFSEIDAGMACEFFEDLHKGVNLPPKSPVRHLRERMVKESMSSLQKGSVVNKRVMAGLFVKAWNYTRLGQDISFLRYGYNPNRPTAMPTIIR